MTYSKQYTDIIFENYFQTPLYVLFRALEEAEKNPAARVGCLEDFLHTVFDTNTLKTEFDICELFVTITKDAQAKTYKLPEWWLYFTDQVSFYPRKSSYSIYHLLHVLNEAWGYCE
jgi:hypothetical protein